MVATLVRLRFALLGNQLRKSPWQLVAVVLGGLYGLGMLALAVAGLIALAWAPIELARTVVVVAGAAVIFGWTVIPALTSGIDQTVDPARLAPFPIPINTLLLALAVSGVLGIPGIITTLAAFATVGTWILHPLAALAAIVCSAIGVLTAVVGSRMLVALASRIGAGRRAREARTLLVIIPLVLLGPIILGVTELLRGVADVLPRVAEIVSLTPFGAIWAVPADVASGDLGRAGIEFLIGIATLGVFVLLWRWGLARALERPARERSTARSGRGAGLFDVFPGTPTGAVAARALTYWIRDPRYAQSLISVPLVPLLIVFYGGLGGNLGALTWVGPVVATLLALSIYTDVSYDNTAFALHLQTGVSGRADRAGRVIALATFAVPVSLLLTVASVAVTGTWPLLPGLLGITVGVLLTGFGISSAISGWFTFAVPAPGESPFRSKPGGGFSLMLSMIACWSALLVLALPELVLAIVGFATGQALYGYLSIVVALLVGGTVLVIGVRVGGRILDRRGPDLLSQLQRQK
ncbi:transporter [Leifsonia sp. H3M29-4]|uniref:transporter n=1 Tax=Salinibacterium metalliresistens TaxID=3031321 RepID=UPI0023D979BC|nr:transporter [Salinibacterium metalliresistens]MDF1479656.1 transporter [Salinibacterium metalliresistens]